MKERGFNSSKGDRLRQAKAWSYCSVCHKKGHWCKDPECPANQDKGHDVLTFHSRRLYDLAG